MAKLYLVRHGETESNRELRFQGQRDTALSAKGMQQAQQVGAYLSKLRLDAVYSSPLQRARVTAEAIAAAQHPALPVQVEADLQEICFGSWEGHNFDEVEAMQPGAWERFFNRPADNPIPDGESLQAAQARAWAVFDRIAAAHPDGRVALVTHGAVLRVLFCSLLGVDLNRIWQIHTANAGTSCFRVDGSYVSLDFFNLASYLKV